MNASPDKPAPAVEVSHLRKVYGSGHTEVVAIRDASLRIERGYWMFCSDAGFQGTCRTFGPGDHPTLPGGLNNRISSGRRISEDYPYQGSPSWNGQPQQGYTQQ